MLYSWSCAWKTWGKLRFPSFQHPDVVHKRGIKQPCRSGCTIYLSQRVSPPKLTRSSLYRVHMNSLNYKQEQRISSLEICKGIPSCDPEAFLVCQQKQQLNHRQHAPWIKGICFYAVHSEQIVARPLCPVQMCLILDRCAHSFCVPDIGVPIHVY